LLDVKIEVTGRSEASSAGPATGADVGRK